MEEVQNGEIGELVVPSVQADAIKEIRSLVNERATVEELNIGELYASRDADGQVNLLPTLDHLMANDNYQERVKREAAKSGLVTVHDPASFVTYVARHGGVGTEVWMDLTARKVTAVIDGDSEEAKGLHQHRVQLQLLYTDEWVEWKKLDRAYVRQSQLSEFIIDHYNEFVEPNAGKMIQLASKFQATKDVDFQSVEHVENGASSVQWIETVNQKQIPGQDKLPEFVTFQTQIFKFGEPEGFKARWFYMIKDKDLFMKLLIDQVKQKEQAAFDALCEQIDTDLSEFVVAPAVFYGSDRD